MMGELQKFVDNTAENVGREYTAASGKKYKTAKLDNFEYTDPIDKSVTRKQVSFEYFQKLRHEAVMLM